MAQSATKTTTKLMAAIAALAIAAAATFLAAPAAQAQADEGALGLTTAPLATQAGDVEYEFKLKGVPYDGGYGIYGTPGEKLTIRASVVARDTETWESTAVKGTTFKWTNVNNKLKAVAKGSKLLIKKLPKAGTYKFTLTAYDADGNKLMKQKYKIVVKKKPTVKVTMRIMGDPDRTKANNSWAYADESIMLNMGGADFGWSNNTKKPFYTWTVKNLDTGKTAVWNANKGFFKKNNLIEAATVAGGANPVLLGKFKQTGTYKITATVYHSNKKIATATKKVTIW